jgi:drug/metabolite transporter (DMT)-like permease
MLIGLGAAVFAALMWGLNFVVFLGIGAYSIFDLALVQYAISGSLCLAFLVVRAVKGGRLPAARDWGMALFLGVIGYMAYFLSLTGAAFYAGPVIAPAFLGLVPVVLAIAGNLRERTVSWKQLALPLSMTAGGLLLVNGSGLERANTGELRSIAVGIALAILAVSLWTWFGLLNQSALARRPDMSASVWTALILLGAAAGMLVFLPVGLALGVFQFPRLGLHWDVAAPLFACAAGGSIFINLGGALAWTIASQRLPVVLAAQMITLEPLFGAVFGLLLHRRWPTLLETVGVIVLLAGVVLAIRSFSVPRSRFPETTRSRSSVAG